MRPIALLVSVVVLALAGLLAASTDPRLDVFPGVVDRTLEGSEPWWPQPAVAPEGAPNIVIVNVDDLGFADLGSYGSEIDTPHLDRLAEQGLRFADFTTHPICSPSRAALLTGRNGHAVGTGWLANVDHGFPGYVGEIDPAAPTLAEILRAHGYTTMMAGKWHNTRPENTGFGADQQSWPVQRGFDHFYGFFGGKTDSFAPAALYLGNELIDLDTYPDDFYATDAWTDQAIQWLREHVASRPERPFFLYLAPNAPHAPVQARAADRAKYRGRYDAGWAVIRDDRLRRQQELGIVPEGTAPAPFYQEVETWDELAEDRRALYARLQEVYAAAVDRIDQEIGRLVDALEALALLDDTVILFTSDNGAGSGVGGASGAVLAHRFAGLRRDPTLIARALADDRIGGPGSHPANPRGWSQVSNTPLAGIKGQVRGGGVRVPLIVVWPGRIADPGSIRHQFVHVTDILPTLLDEIGIPFPSRFRHQPTTPLDGISFARLLGDGEAPGPRRAQYYEVASDRAYTEDGFKIVSEQQRGRPFDDTNWRLYDLATDLAETVDLAGQASDRVAAMADAFDSAALTNQVYPLMHRGASRGPPDARQPGAVLVVARTFQPGTQTVPRRVISPLIAERDFEVVARFHHDRGDDGVIYALGDRHSGFALMVEGDSLRLVYNAFGRRLRLPRVPLAPGDHEVVFAYDAGPDRHGSGRLWLDGEEVGFRRKMQPSLGRGPFEGLDIGLDRRGPVDPRAMRGRGAFPYGGTIESVTILPGELVDEEATRAGRR